MSIQSITMLFWKLCELPLRLVWVAMLIFGGMVFLVILAISVQAAIGLHHEPHLFRNLLKFEIAFTRYLDVQKQEDEEEIDSAKKNYEKAWSNINHSWISKLEIKRGAKRPNNLLWGVPNDDANLAQWLAMSHYYNFVRGDSVSVNAAQLLLITIIIASIISTTISQITKRASLFLSRHSVQAREAHKDYFAWELNFKGLIYSFFIALGLAYWSAVASHSDELHQLGFNITSCTILALSSAYIAVLVPITIRKVIDVCFIWRGHSPKQSYWDDAWASIASILTLYFLYKNTLPPVIAVTVLGIFPDVASTRRHRLQHNMKGNSQSSLEPQSQQITRLTCLVGGLIMLVFGFLIDVPSNIELISHITPPSVKESSIRIFDNHEEASGFFIILGACITSLFYGLKASPSK